MTGQQKVHRLVIVGGGAAGDAAAEAARRAGFEGEVLLVGADRHPAYHRPYLSKQYLRDELPFERVFLHRPDVYERLKVEWLTGRRAVAGSRPESSITLDDGRSLRFDALVLATGGSPRWPAEIPRADNVFSLRSLDDCLALKQALAGSRRLLHWRRVHRSRGRSFDAHARKGRPGCRALRSAAAAGAGRRDG